MAMKTLYSLLYNNKGLQLGLWMIWLCGFLLISVSFYATQILTTFSFNDQIIRVHKIFVDHEGPTIAIFTAPRPFTGLIGERQALAVRSWLGLSANITVVLCSQDPSVTAFAHTLGSRVSIEPNIDFSFLNTAFFHSMVARSQASSSDISVVIDPEIVLLPDFISTLSYALKLDQDWLLYASSQNISYFPFHLDADSKYWLAEDGKPIKIQKLQEFVARKQLGQSCEGKMILAWNKGDLPLHKGILPPFLFEAGIHYHWVISEALSSNLRFVFEASSTISNFYMDDELDRNHIGNVCNQLVKGSLVLPTSSKCSEFIVNSHLASLYGSMYFHEANFSNLFQSSDCGGHYIFVNTVQDIVYLLDNQRSLSLRRSGLLGFMKQRKILDCIGAIKSVEGHKESCTKNQLKLSSSVSLPFSLEYLLSMRADRNKTIVLAVAGYSYKDMLMSWVCRLRHLQISNYLVCALDNELYEFSVLQGLPIFKYAHPPTNQSFDNCHFGTECFQKVTKVKSRMVLQILKLGYNVLMSDVDVYWFKNPLPLLSSFGPAVLVAQSDEYKATGPINLPRRLNSGFYYVYSDDITMAALEKVVKHAAKSNLSEQPSFYDTLCGEGGSYRLGDNRCLEPETNLTTYFLDRDLFPNGAYQDLWKRKNVKETCMKKGCFILHNNWISGRNKKLERQVLSALWQYDMSSRMCLWSWHRTEFTSYF